MLAAGALAAAGCGSSDKSSAQSGDTAKAGAAETGIVAEARKAIDAAKQPLHFKAPGPQIDASKVKGKAFFVISVDQRVPTLAAAAKAMQEAGATAGLKVTVFDAKANVSRMQQGVTQAAGQKAGAIALLGIPTALVADKLKSAGIPAVAVLNNDPQADAPGQGAGEGVFATSAPPYSEAGRLLAYKAILDTNGKANVVVFNSKGIDPAPPTMSGIEGVLKRCSGCRYTTNDTPLADWSTKLTPLAQSEIRRNPKANYLLPLFDGMGLFAATGVRQAGAAGKVKLAAFNGVPAGLELVQKGDVFTADPGQSNEWVGWHAVDQAMRGMLGLDPAEPVVPLRFFDADSLKGLDVNDESSLYGSEFKAGYRGLWGVG
jgi:ribose transport system substrate-binding protein